mmetsp:Transcript_14615/g.63295  ORF Transcript_14615/g.63295 Transcript_14615/m.63295 type:complete len:201 (+) Transcript_14615:1634-2236(+)
MDRRRTPRRHRPPEPSSRACTPALTWCPPTAASPVRRGCVARGSTLSSGAAIRSRTPPRTREPASSFVDWRRRIANGGSKARIPRKRSGGVAPTTRTTRDPRDRVTARANARRTTTSTTTTEPARTAPASAPGRTPTARRRKGAVVVWAPTPPSAPRSTRRSSRTGTGRRLSSRTFRLSAPRMSWPPGSTRGAGRSPRES